MRRAVLLLFSVAAATAILLEELPDACTTVRCSSGLSCAMILPAACNVSPCPRMPTCVPQNQTCEASNSCAADETCILRQVTCIRAPCYPVKECVKYPKCAAGEEYNECSLSSPCEPTCTEAFPICANVSCGAGACECKAGYFRHNGTCITKPQCPEPTCAKNETRSTCPSNCPQTCRSYRGKTKEMMCIMSCGPAACVCAAGYVRDDDYNCVKQDDCPKEFKCNSPHEEYRECSSHCEPTCDNRSPTCIESCGPAKCQCKAGFVRDQGDCISGHQCPMEDYYDSASSEDDDQDSDEEDNSIHIKPFPPHVRPAFNFSDVNGTASIMPLPFFGNGTMFVKPFIPLNNSTMTIMPMPNFGNKTTLIRPFLPANHSIPINTPAVMPIHANNSSLIDPIPLNLSKPAILVDPFISRDLNATISIMPFFGNGSLVRPAFPGATNGTKGPIPFVTIENRPISILPFKPTNGSDKPTMHILPIFENGTMHVRPFFPSNSSDLNGTMHIMPVIENGTMHILPFLPSNSTDNGTMHIMPMPMPGHGGIHILPYIPVNASEDGTMHILPYFGNETMHILPFIPANGTDHNGTMNILPYFGNVNGSENGTMHILPFYPEHLGGGKTNETMHILPYFGNETIYILPFIPANGTDHNGTMHILPYFGNETMHILPSIPVNGSENGTMHILPFYPEQLGGGKDNETIHIMPVKDDQITPTSCASLSCPVGQRCEEITVQCFVAPCPKQVSCVGTTTKDDQPACGRNEEYSDCAPSCQETCRGKSECSNLAMVAMCRGGCVCKDRFKRDTNGVCVPNHKCWKSAGCRDNESWHKCHACEPTCEDSMDACPHACSSGCGCDDGFVRGPSGDCILPEECPSSSSSSTAFSNNSTTRASSSHQTSSSSMTSNVTGTTPRVTARG